MANTTTLDFTVIGEQTIHCAGCEQRIGNALHRLPGIREVAASHQTQGVRVAIDPAQVDAAQIRGKLEQLGYEVAPGAR